MKRLKSASPILSVAARGARIGALAAAIFASAGRPLVAAEAAHSTLSEPLAASLLPDVPPLGDEAGRFLPTVSRRLVLRLGDRRVYLYEGDVAVVSYPVAVGRAGWETPTGQFAVFQKVKHPIWQHPFTQEIVPPGPQNPLGARWIGFWTDGENSIGFHGTPNEELIGQAVSHGCVRMRNADIAALFERVEMGTPVIVER